MANIFYCTRLQLDGSPSASNTVQSTRLISLKLGAVKLH
jgi:hypothetical protein